MSVNLMMEQDQLRDLRPLTELADEDLVTAHLDGRPGAFQHLYDRYRNRLVHFIIRKTGDADRAQDLVQEAFIRVTRHLHRFDTTKKFSTWVYTIAGNLAKTELRKKKRRQTSSLSTLGLDDKDYEIPSFELETGEYIQGEYTEKKIQEAIKSLPLHFRTVIILRDIQELSYEEISNIVSVPLGTVKSRINRARLQLQEALKDYK